MSNVRVDQVEQLAAEVSANPAAVHDSTQGYTRGMRWLNTATGRIWVIVDDTPGAAIWREDTPSPGGTADFDKIVTAKYTGVHSTRYAHEVPLVVIDNAGNVVTQT